jgi:predicted acylesterase/phospholipase RssA
LSPWATDLKRRHRHETEDLFKHVQRLRGAAAGLLEKLPDDLKNSPEAQFLRPAVDRKVYNIVQLIYRAKNYEGYSKDYEFSRAGMEEHWRAGYHDARAHCGIAKCCSDPAITRVSLHLILL